MTPDVRVVFGDLDLLAEDPRGFRLVSLASSEGMDLGASEALVQTIESFLADGAIVATTGHGNRTLTLPVQVQGADAGALAVGEAALVAECAKTWAGASTTLSYTPPGGFGPTSVFEIVAAELTPTYDDFSETRPDRLGRRYSLVLTALPWSRSVDPVRVSVPAPAVAAETLIDDGASTSGWSADPVADVLLDGGDSTTGWSVTSGWTLSASGGAVRASHSWSGYAMQATLTRSGLSVAKGGARYLRVTSSGGNISVKVNGYTAPIAAATVVSSGADVSYFAVPSSITTINTVAVTGSFTFRTEAPTPSTVAFAVFDVKLTGQRCGADPLLASGSHVTLNLTTIDPSRPVPATLTRTGLAVDLTGKPYLRVTAGSTVTQGFAVAAFPTLYLNGSSTPRQVVAGSGNTVWVDVSDLTTLTSIKLAWSVAARSDVASVATSLWFDQAAASTVPALVSTNRELSRVVEVDGSVRAPASLTLHDDTPTGLGTTLVYTCPVIDALAQPPLRGYLTTGPAPTPDSTTCSGAYSDLSTTHVFDVPVTALHPGSHLLIARVKATAAGSYPITWQATTRIGTGEDAGVSGSTTVTLAANTWTFVTVALVVLPTRAAGSNGLARIRLTGASLSLDNAYAYNTDVGELTWVDCGSGTPVAGGASSQLWLDSPDLDNPVPSVTMGPDTGRADGAGAGTAVRAFGAHRFEPPSVNVHTVASGSTACAVDLEYFPHWHTHAAQ